MENRIGKKRMIRLLCFGVLGCILMGASDWMMVYGDVAFEGELAWLTLGVAQIAPWRNSAAMFLAFPAVIFYSIALLGLGRYFPIRRYRSIYSALTAVGMTPWLCLHLFYTMILYIFAWMMNHGPQKFALEVCQEVFNHFMWIVPISELMMLLPFSYLFWLIGSGKSALSRWMAVNNPLIVYVLLKVLTLAMPDTAFRLAFVNGLMSESMLICFGIYIIYTAKHEAAEKD